MADPPFADQEPTGVGPHYGSPFWSLYGAFNVRHTSWEELSAYKASQFNDPILHSYVGNKKSNCPASRGSLPTEAEKCNGHKRSNNSTSNSTSSGSAVKIPGKVMKKIATANAGLLEVHGRSVILDGVANEGEPNGYAGKSPGTGRVQHDAAVANFEHPKQYAARPQGKTEARRLLFGTQRNDTHYSVAPGNQQPFFPGNATEDLIAGHGTGRGAKHCTEDAGGLPFLYVLLALVVLLVAGASLISIWKAGFWKGCGWRKRGRYQEASAKLDLDAVELGEWNEMV